MRIAPPPSPRQSTEGTVDPSAAPFSAFIFKIQANMNPAHRDCIAFMRICSGVFNKGMTVRNTRAGRDIRLGKSHQFLAADRAEIETAFPGDIVGLYDSGNFRIGDTLAESGSLRFEGIPRFAPEHFSALRLKDPSKRKQLKKGLEQLLEEGAVQIFHKPGVGEMEPILGAVGVLQFDVLSHRLKQEYGVDIVLDRMPYEIARWLGGDFDPKAFGKYGGSLLVEDRDGNPTVLFRDEWSLNWEIEKNPAVQFLDYAP